MCDFVETLKDEILEIENEDVVFTPTIDGDVYKAAKPTLTDMPVEIILKICSYLDADVLKHTLSKVCERFENILADNQLWKYWVHSRINACYPPLLHLNVWDEVDIDWEGVCVEMDVEKKKWSNVEETMKHIVVKDIHFASVDTVLLVNNGEICISGGRDRGMALWDVMNIKPNENESTSVLTNATPRHIKHDAHAGWIWDLAADNLKSASLVYSASWDNTVKAWDLETGFNCIEKFKCRTSALSVVTCDKIIMAGLYSKKILSFDIRAGPTEINSYKAHRGPVLALNVHKNMIASVSEDKTLAVWDRVAGKLLVSDVKLPKDKVYPVCISWSQSAMYIGDSKGSLHLFHPEKYSPVKSHELWSERPLTEPSSKISGCHQSPGNIIACSDRGEIKFLYNCSPPREYSTVKTSTVDVTQLRYLNGILVVGTCDSALEFWVPVERYQET